MIADWPRSKGGYHSQSRRKYRAKDALELVHDDLCGPITPATNDGRWYFLLLVDDYSHYMWLQLLTSKDEAVMAIKKFKRRADESIYNLYMCIPDRKSRLIS